MRSHEQLVEQILGRQVDGDAESMAVPVECGDRFDAALENEVGERADQTALLGDPDEVDRRNRPSRRVMSIAPTPRRQTPRW